MDGKLFRLHILHVVCLFTCKCIVRVFLLLHQHMLVCFCFSALRYEWKEKGQDECDVYGSKLYIIVIVKSVVGPWKRGLALIALSPTPIVIQIWSSTNLKKIGFVYSNVLRQYVSSNVLSILSLSGFTLHRRKVIYRFGRTYRWVNNDSIFILVEQFL